VFCLPVYVRGGWEGLKTRSLTVSVCVGRVEEEEKGGKRSKESKGNSYMCTKGNERKGKERYDEKIECVSSDRNRTGTMKVEREREGGTTSGVLCGCVLLWLCYFSKSRTSRKRRRYGFGCH